MDTALDQLGVDEQEAEIQILEEPQTGLFGRLKVEARVRARVRPTAPRAKVDRRDRRRSNERRNRKGSRPEKGSTSSAKAKAPSGGGGKKHDASGNGSSDERKSEKQASAKERPEGSLETDRGQPDGGQSGSGSKRRRRRRGGGSGSKQGAQVSNNEDAKTDSTPDLEGQRVAVEEFLTGLMTAFGRPEATVSAAVGEEDTISVDVEGNELGLLVGPKGQTLQALHELTRSVVQRRFVGEAHARLHLDVAGYRQRRAEALERFTREVAEEVVSSGRSKALDPMPANDRKIIHDVINEIDGVETVSEGEDPYRRVVIRRS